MSGLPLPPSMPAGSHEMRDHYSNQGPPREAPHTAPSVTPYLGLQARLSQVWINRWTILLLLVLVRTLIAIQGINHNTSTARREALSACSDVEAMGSAMASMPHYMSTGVNSLTAAGIEKSVNGLMSMSTLSVTAVEEIVVFVIGMMTNTYLCLITLAVSGSLQSVIKVVDAAQDDINKLGTTIGGEMGDALKDFTDAYNKATDAIEKGASLFSVKFPDAPNVDSQVDQLNKFKLPDSLDADLQKLNDSIPTFAEVKNLTETAIRFPFKEVKELINENLGTYEFNKSLFPVPAKEQLSFCSDSDGINDFFDKLDDMAATATKIFIAVLVVSAIAAMVPMGWREIRRWRHQQERSRMVNTGATHPMDVVYLVSRPYTSSFGLWTARVSPEPEAIKTASRRQNLIRWAVAYATTDAALFVLCLAIAGLFSCLCQYILLRQIQSQTPALSNQVGVFADKVVAQLTNASEQWAIGTNKAIEETNTQINHDMFGWVEKATTAVNATLNTFVNETSKVLDDAFGGTPLEDPIKEVLNCLVLLKIQGIQNALTWVKENAHVNFPTLPNDTFSVGALASLSGDSKDGAPDQSFLAEPNDKASDKITSAVQRVVEFLADGIRTEALISTVVLLLWVFIALIGALTAIVRGHLGRDKSRGNGGSVLQRNSVGTDSGDFRSDNQDRFTSDIPLTNMHNVRPFEPAPEYSEVVKPSARSNNPYDGEVEYQDSKLGLATDSVHEKRGGFI